LIQRYKSQLENIKNNREFTSLTKEVNLNWKNKNLLMMSSGTFDGIEFEKLIT